MTVSILKKTVLCSLVLALSGCGLFSKDKIQLDGERLAVLKENYDLAPDYAPGAYKIKLPKPYENSQWSQNGGNSEHNLGHLAAGDKLKEAWSSSFGEGSSKRDFLISAPIVAHQVVFTIDADAEVSAFRLDNGKKIWSRRLKPLNRDDKSVAMKGAGLAVFDKKLYATTGFGGVFCQDMVSGNVLWRYDTEAPIRIAPTVNNNLVFVQTIANKLIALDAKNGKELWKYETSTEMTTVVGGASPAYSPRQDVLVAAFSNGELRAFKASTGTPLWGDMIVSPKRTNALADITAIKANPVIADDKVFVVGNNSLLAAIDLRTGSRLWQREVSSDNQPWVAGRYLYLLSNDFELVALEKDTGKIIWNTTLPNGEEDDEKNGVFASGPVLVSNRLIAATSNGYVFSVSPYTGEIISYLSVSDGVEVSPVVADSATILTTNDADIIAYK